MNNHVIAKNRILLVERVMNKEEAIYKLATSLFDDGKISDISAFLVDIQKREEEYCTYVGHEIAIPHAISCYVQEASIAFLRTKEAFVYGDETESTRLLFMLAIPCNSNAEHLRMLSTLASKLVHAQFRKSLMEAETIHDVYEVLIQQS